MFDEIDLKIISILKSNGRTSIKDLSKQCGVSAGTARNRLLSLKRQGIIVDYKARVRPSALDYEDVLVGFDIAPESFIQALEGIRLKEFVKELYRTAGDHVAIALVEVSKGSAAERIKELEGIEGVKKVYPAFIQDIVK
ncbi:MAG: Lrp/AsnC family transcriptional regulator [Candidatus Micrarchaeia archaeon]